MLEGTNSSGKFKVQVSWTPNDIGKDNLFGVKFFDAASGSEISNATYTIMLFKGWEHLSNTHREGQTAAQQRYTFDEQGSYRLRIENINGSGTEHGIDIPIQVTPEFSIGMFTMMMSGVLIGLAAIVVMLFVAR
jgi:hypothetical protein